MKKKRGNQIKFFGPQKATALFPNQILSPRPRKSHLPLTHHESIRSRRLSKFGDADFDGSPNIFDCNPRRADQDGLFSAIGDFFRKKKTQGAPKEKLVSTNSGWKLAMVASPTRTGPSRAQQLASSLQRRVKPLAKAASYRPKKEQRRAQKRSTRRALNAVALLTPEGTVSVPSSKSEKGKRHTGKVGRPRGPSGKYQIPGAGPVGVYQYRKWASRQRKLRQLEGKPAQMSVPPSATESVDTPDYEEDYGELTQRTPYVPQATQQKSVDTGDLTQTQLMQLQMQQQDNILKAPQINKGELKATGGNILTPNGRPTILQAPNVLKGQMRNLQPRNPVELSERPITNPHGDFYVEIDPITGKPFLQRRPREKWATGEAL